MRFLLPGVALLPGLVLGVALSLAGRDDGDAFVNQAPPSITGVTALPHSDSGSPLAFETLEPTETASEGEIEATTIETDAASPEMPAANIGVLPEVPAVASFADLR